MAATDIGALAGWFALSAAGAVTTRLVQTGAVAGTPAPTWLRPFVALDAIAFYLWKLVVPISMGIDYGRSPAWLQQSGVWKFTWLAPAAVTVALLLLRASARIWIAAAVFVIGLLPVLGLVTFNFQFYSTVADHYMFLPVLGIALALAEIMSQMMASRRYLRVLIGAIMAACLLVFSAVSIVQSSHWRTSRDLFSRAIQVNPSSFVSHYDLAVLDEREQRPSEAINEFQAAIAARRDYVPARSELGAIMLRIGLIDDGLSQLVTALEMTRQAEPNVDLSRAYVDIARAAQKAGRFDLSRRLAQQVFQFYPHDPDVRQMLRELEPNHP